MMLLRDPWGWLLALHILCAVFWVGGMFFALHVVRPALAVLEPPQRVALHHRVFARFFRVVWAVAGLSLVSGFGLVAGRYGGFAGLPWNIDAMMGLGLVMVAVFALIVFGPYRRFRAAVGTARALEAAERIRRLIALNLVLGTVVVVLAAL